VLNRLASNFLVSESWFIFTYETDVYIVEYLYGFKMTYVLLLTNSL